MYGLGVLSEKHPIIKVKVTESLRVTILEADNRNSRFSFGDSIFFFIRLSERKPFAGEGKRTRTGDVVLEITDDGGQEEAMMRQQMKAALVLIAFSSVRGVIDIWTEISSSGALNENSLLELEGEHPEEEGRLEEEEGLALEALVLLESSSVRGGIQDWARIIED